MFSPLTHFVLKQNRKFLFWPRRTNKRFISLEGWGEKVSYNLLLGWLLTLTSEICNLLMFVYQQKPIKWMSQPRGEARRTLALILSWFHIV